MNIETAENQQRDSDMIFTQITSGDFPTWELAQQALAFLYIPDMTISRAGISHAMKRLERHYSEANTEDKSPEGSTSSKCSDK